MAFVDFVPNLDFTHWGLWLIGAAGLGAAVLPLVVGRYLYRRHADEEPDQKEDTYPPVRDPFVHGNSREQRWTPRRKGGAVGVLISDEKALATPWHGMVLNRSLGGLCLATDRTIAPGTII